MSAAIGAIGGAAGAALAGGAAWWLWPMEVKRRQKRELRERSRGTLSLTYDDGPSPDRGDATTHALLDLLRERGARATFFLKGCAIPGAERVIDRIASDGHEIGSHSRDHLHAWRVSPRASRRDLERGAADANRWAGDRHLLRPPYGKWTLSGMRWMQRAGHTPAWWTIDGGDTHEPRPNPSAAADQLAAAGGGVVLLHDFDQGPAHRDFVLSATAAALDVAAERGLAVRTMGEVLGAAGRPAAEVAA